MAIRETILDTLSTLLATIDGTGSWNRTITTVVTEIRSIEDVVDSELDLIAIVPQDELYEYQPGILVTRWNIDLIAHLNVTDTTMATHIAAVSDVTADLRRLFANNSSNLGVDGVHMVTLKSRAGTEGMRHAAQEQRAESVYRIEVKFQEAINE